MGIRLIRHLLIVLLISIRGWGQVNIITSTTARQENRSFSTVDLNSTAGSNSVHFGPHTSTMQILPKDNNSTENGGNVDEIIRLHQEMGFKWERSNLFWCLAEYPKGTYHWQEFDDRIKKMFDAGIRTTVSICSGNNFDGSFRYTIPGLDGLNGSRNDYRDFVKKCVERYDGDGIDDAPFINASVNIKHWEGWNEPVNWHEISIEQATDIYNDYYESCKAADPNCIVISPGFAWDYLFEYFIQNAVGFDMLSVHSNYWYLDEDDPDHEMEINIVNQDNKFRQWGLGNRPWWISEFGIIGRGWEDMDHNIYSLRSMRMYVVSLYQMFHTSLVASTHFYSEGSKLMVLNWGSWTLRPCGEATKTYLEIFQDSDIVGSEKINTTNDCQIYKFTKSNGLSKYALWTWESNGNRQVTLNITTPQVRKTNLYGDQVQTINVTGGSINLTAGAAPVYLEEITSDTTPPNAPRNLWSNEQTETTISLTWDSPEQASDGETASSYVIQRNGIEIANSVATLYVDIALSENSSYNYEIYSLDAAGNKSLSSAAGIFQTKCDNTPPDVSSVLVLNENAVQVVFNEKVESNSAQDENNYSIDNNIDVQMVELKSDEKTVLLSTSTLSSDVIYTLSITGISDLSSSRNEIIIPVVRTFQLADELILTNIWVGSGENYVQAYLIEGDEFYIDRDLTISDIPDDYEGYLWLKTANDDKTDIAPEPFVTFTVNHDVDVFVGYDARLVLPKWLEDWEYTENSIRSSDEWEKNRYHLYRREFSQGQVNLGPNMAETNSSNMYIVLVQKVGGSSGHDTVPPEITAVNSTQVNSSSITIEWNTSEPSTSQVEYGETSNYGLNTDEVDTYVTSHEVTITGLSSNTTYFYRVISKDASGNAGYSQDYSFTTLTSQESFVWHSYNVTTLPGLPQAAVYDEGGVLHANLELYESINDDGVNKGDLFQYYFTERHAEDEHKVENFWTNHAINDHDDEAVPYVGKSYVPRGENIDPPSYEQNPPPPLGVYDIRMHPPKNDHLTVVAFIIPRDGDYSIFDIAFRRDNEWLAQDPPEKSIIFRIFNPEKQVICQEKYVSQQKQGPWMILSETFSFPDLLQGDRIYFTVDNDGLWGVDGTEVTWTITGNVAPGDITRPAPPTGLSVGITP